ncbi:MAG: hypothetical protein GY810_02260, partial [Aureispira sp.]|nr:hypothetical protein [Aureispira sp.]
MDESPINTINRLKSDLAKLEAKLKEQMLECTVGVWHLTGQSDVSNGISNQAGKSLGVEYETEAKAIEAGKRRVQQEIINNHATRLNKETGYIPDWKDWHQTKCYIEFDMRYKK